MTSFPAIAVAVAALLQASEPSLDEVLRRAGAYTERFHDGMTSVVAEERYVQQLGSQSPGGGGRSRPFIWTERRTLISDFVLIAGTGREPRWMAFRDVLQVDGTPVRDRDDRLQKLFAAGGDAIDRALALSQESSRYNIGPEGFVRTVNVPVIAMDFLLPEMRPRFAFHKRSVRQTADGARTWEIEFAEKDRPTVIRTPKGESIVARGTLWIEPDEGRIVESTLELWERRAKISVTYEVDPRLHIAVPVRMKESYLLGRDLLDGEAIYSNYRRFETSARVVPK